MNTPVSNVTLNVFDNFIKNRLPASLNLSTDRRRNIILSVIAKIHSLYVDNNKGVYIDTEPITFYNAAQNDFLNIRSLTRWCGISGDNLPNGFRACKLLSCNLKQANPDLIEYPPGVAYIQDLPISLTTADKANTATPAANTGLIALVETNRLITVITLGIANSWTNVASIDAILAYYRLPILPDWDTADRNTVFIDILPKDFDLAAKYVEQEVYGNATPLKILRQIEQAENDIKFK